MRPGVSDGLSRVMSSPASTRDFPSRSARESDALAQKLVATVRSRPRRPLLSRVGRDFSVDLSARGEVAAGRGFGRRAGEWSSTDADPALSLAQAWWPFQVFAFPR